MFAAVNFNYKLTTNVNYNYKLIDDLTTITNKKVVIVLK